MSRSFLTGVVVSLFGGCIAASNLQAAPILLQAGTIVRPSDGAFSVAQYSSAAPSRAFDNSGMASPLDTGDAVPVVYSGHGNVGHPGDAAMTDQIQTFSMTFDLGTVYDLNQTASMHLWNYNEGGGGNGRGIRTASLFYTSLGTNIGNATGWVQATTNSTFNIAPGTAGYTGEDYTFLNNVSARFVRFDVTANYSNLLPAAGNYTGISEIAFITADIFAIPVPEPSTMAILGAAGLGMLVLRRNRRRSA